MSGIVISLVVVALATDPSLNKLVPLGDVVKKSTLPAVPEHTKFKPCNLDLPANITSAAELLIPADTLPAGLPTAEIPDIVLKNLVPVAVPALAPVIDSV